MGTYDFYRRVLTDYNIDKDVHNSNKDHSSRTFRNMDQITSFVFLLFILSFV